MASFDFKVQESRITSKSPPVEANNYVKRPWTFQDLSNQQLSGHFRLVSAKTSAFTDTQVKKRLLRSCSKYRQTLLHEVV